MNAIFTVWISTFGNMENLYSDGELGLTNDSAKAQFKRMGITLKVRAPGQHARYVERHGAILRVTMHLTEEQCKREGISVHIDMLTAQSLFVCNALTTVGQATPGALSTAHESAVHAADQGFATYRGRATD